MALILYSMVARETTVLAEFNAFSQYTAAIARLILNKLPTDVSRLSISAHPYLFHVLRSDALVFICLAHHTFPRTTAFVYLEYVLQRFMEEYGKVAHDPPPYSMIDEFSSVLHQQIEFISSTPTSDALNRVTLMSEHIHTIVVEDIEKLLGLDIGVHIELLEDKSTTVVDSAIHHSDAESLEIDMKRKCVLSAKDGTHDNGTSTETGGDFPCDSLSDDDWEAIADLPPEKLLAPQIAPKVVDHTPQNHEVKAPKRRGRGTFSYKKEELYCDQVSSGSCPAEPPEVIRVQTDDYKGNSGPHSSRYDTGHVLVLNGFSPTTKTTDLKKLFEDFKGGGFVIRWVDDTTALVVFQTPSTALEALKCKKLPFNVRVLDKGDRLVDLVTAKDLEPPRQRPLTSAVTARRLIAHGMGIKLPSGSGSAEFRKQEEARKERIIARQSLKEDAWGDDD